MFVSSPCGACPSRTNLRPCTSQTRPGPRALHSSRRVLMCSTTETLESSTDPLIHAVDAKLDASLPITRADIQSIVTQFADSRGMKRLELVQLLGRVAAATPAHLTLATPVLTANLRAHPNAVVRRSCGKALAHMRASQATPELIETLLHDDDTVTRGSAAGALARMGPAAVGRLVDVIVDGSVGATARGHAMWAIEFMREEAVEPLFDAARREEPAARAVAVRALTGIASVEDDGVPGAEFDDADDMPLEPTESWSNDGRGRFRDRILEWLFDSVDQERGTPEVLTEVVFALGEMRNDRAVEPLLQLTRHENVDVRRASCLALMKIGAMRAVDTLRDVSNLPDEADEVRRVADLAIAIISRQNAQ